MDIESPKQDFIDDSFHDGRNSTLHNGIWSGQTVVYKIFPKDENSQNYMAKTRTAYGRLDGESQYVLQYYHSDSTDTQVIVIVSRGGENLQTTINNKPELSRSEQLEIVSKMSRGFRFLHEKGVVHGSGKPSKVLITKNEESGEYQVKLTGFGVSHIYNNDVHGEFKLQSPYKVTI